MKVVGIVAEYNPFHNGHRFHMEQAKALTGADYTVVVMSGDFTQRGAPALVDKYARTQMALECGADLVIELPLYYACGSAEYFAKGAVCLLDKLGIVDSICFGSECGDIHLLSKVARALHQESGTFITCLKEYMKEGHTFPQARALALTDTLEGFAEHGDILSSPNNILGIEYIKAILSLNSPIVPFTNLRIGSTYHEKRLAEHNSSAIAIRQSLRQKQDLSLIREQIPAAAYMILQEHFIKTAPLFTDDLSLLLHYKLLSIAPGGYTSYIDVTKEISHRIQNKLHLYTSFSSFCELLKTKDITYTRINRCLIHILLDMKKDTLQGFCEDGYIQYARMLGFCKESSALLSGIKKNSSIPLLSKLADAKRLLSGSKTAFQMLQTDIQASHIYDAVSNKKHQYMPPGEYARTIVIH